MTHRSNGKHRHPASEPTNRFKAETVSDRPNRSNFEAGLAHTHDAIVKKTVQFIRDRPTASLVLAAALGGTSWLARQATKLTRQTQEGVVHCTPLTNWHPSLITRELGQALHVRANLHAQNRTGTWNIRKRIGQALYE